MAAQQGSDAEEHLVILVHGIRDHGEWMHELRPCLVEAGFAVEVAGYEFFDLLRFLFPLEWFRRNAIRRVWTHIQYARNLHRDAKDVSVIAHSFGTYIVSEILTEEFDFKAHRLIFCGSVAKSKFRLPHLQGRFTPPILNEIGTRDIWPVIAETVTWGYGSVGRLGFKQPGVLDCFHNRFHHGDFLKTDFCRTHWIPFLKEGKEAPAAGPIERVPWWLTVLVVFQPKYVLLLLLAFAALVWWCLPDRITIERIGGQGARLMSQNILDAVEAAERPCPVACEITRLRNGAMRMNLLNEEMLRNLYVCSADPLRVEYREGLEGLTRLQEVVPCLDLHTIGSDRIDISVRDVDTVLVRSVKTGRRGWVCRGDKDCSEAVQTMLDEN